MRATVSTVSLLVGICLFVAGCSEKESANLFNWGQQEQVAQEYDYEYEYDCYEDGYYSDAGEREEEYQEDYYNDYYGQYDTGESVAYGMCEHGYWYPHEDCGYGN